MIKNQKRLIIIGIPVLIALILLYFFVVAPLLDISSSEADPPELLEGEILSSDNNILMFDQVQRAAIKTIEVHNEKGSFTFYLDKDGNFYIEGMEGAPYNLESFANFLVAAGYTLTKSRVMTDCQNMSDYGLAEEDNPSWYELTTAAGIKHKVYIGNKTVDQSGYYARYEGRNAVYILDSSIESTLLCGIHSMITPILSYQLNESNYYKADDIFLIRDGKPVVWIDYVSEEEVPTAQGMGNWKMLYPTAYTVNATSLSTVLELFTGFYGLETVEFGSSLTDDFFDDNYEDGEVGDAELDADAEAYYQHLKETYGIDIKNPAFMVSYTINDITSYVIFSEPDISGMMYAYSSLYDLVATIHSSSVEFLTWSIVGFVDRPIFIQNISDVAKIQIESEKVNCTFFIEGKDQEISVTTNLSSKPLGASMYRSFQEWYREFVGLYIQDKAESNAKDNLYATITVTNDAGEVTVYRFYPYSTRRCLVTINDVGEFYLLLDEVERLIADANRIMNGESVEADSSY